LRAFLDDFHESFSDCGHVLRGNVGTDNFADEFATGFITFRVDRLDVSDDSGVLTSTSCLFLVQIVKVLSLEDGFS